MNFIAYKLENVTYLRLKHFGKIAANVVMEAASNPVFHRLLLKYKNIK